MNPQKSPKKDDKEFLRKGARLSGMALQMGLTIYLGNLFGKWIDTEYTTDFAETLFTLLAIALAMYAMIRQVTQLNK
ncbi:MAG: AtpZ/AtpI family protein [Bacteroidota bacterium]|nr:AtpZ/AtpI family protein [uncultured Allomuricauda sp.]